MSPTTPAPADCPICLDPMSLGDALHPPQCPTRCGYNFCVSCIESLISSSKDGYSEASDGNRHVKVWLHCPQCRSDLGGTIRDTVLLRKVEDLRIAAGGAAAGVNDSELSASELRMRAAMDDGEVRRAVEEARAREAAFLGLGGGGPDGGKENGGGGIAEPPSFGDAAAAGIDLTLFGGREYAMTTDEQRVVTEMMTSGSVTKLAAAALFLHDATKMAREGKTGAKREMEAKSSVKALIDESRQARDRAAATEAGAAAAAVLSAQRRQGQRGGGGALVTRSQHRDFEREMRRKADYLRAHPLPVRMPNYVELQLRDPKERAFPLAFCDDEWDGTVTDAFSKITISGRSHKVTKNKPESPGVQNVVVAGGRNGGRGGGKDKIGEPRGRVLVAAVKAEGGRMGIVRGDVVTHLDGEEFRGTASDLVDAIGRRAAQAGAGGGDFSLTLNAERSTAEALRRRVMIGG